MKRFKQFVLLMVLVLLIPGCAVNYHRINPNAIVHPSFKVEDGLKYAYKYDVLRTSGNKRYAKYELKRGMRLVGVQLTNLSDSTIRLSRDCDLYAGGVTIIPMDIIHMSKTLRQKELPYLLYMLLTNFKLEYTVSTPSQTTTGSFPIGAFLGPGLTLLNGLKAGIANKRMTTNLLESDIWNRDIQSGETVSGLVGIEGRDFLRIEIKKK